MTESEQGIEITRRRGFAAIPHDILQDTALSWKAKGLLSYLLGRPPGWQARVTDLINQGSDGKAAVRSALKELRIAGYAELKQHRARGKIVRWKWTIKDHRGNLHTDFQEVGIQELESRDISKKELSKKEKKPLPLILPEGINCPEFAEAWDEFVTHRKEQGKKMTPTAKSRQLKALDRMGKDKAIRAIHHSVAQGWQGIHLAPEDKQEGGSKRTNGTATAPKADLSHLLHE